MPILYHEFLQGCGLERDCAYHVDQHHRKAHTDSMSSNFEQSVCLQVLRKRPWWYLNQQSGQGNVDSSDQKETNFQVGQTCQFVSVAGVTI